MSNKSPLLITLYSLTEFYDLPVTSTKPLNPYKGSNHSPVLTEIFCATKRPPITASPVHKACPSDPPTTTPITSSLVASTTVASCDRSPHSARKVNDAAWNSTLSTAFRLRLLFSAWPCSSMSSVSSLSSCNVTVWFVCDVNVMKLTREQNLGS